MRREDEGETKYRKKVLDGGEKGGGSSVHKLLVLTRGVRSYP